MIKEIKYGGFTAQPSDYECQDGDLAASINLINEDGNIKAISQPFVEKEMPSDTSGKIVFIHETSSFKHYIIQEGNYVKWLNGLADSDEMTVIVNLASYEIYGYNAVGNTLIILTSGGMYYTLWKDGSYLNLGTHIPELPISFGLQGEMIRGEEFQITFDNIAFYSGDIWNEFTESNRTKITGQVLAKVNKFIAENSTNVGKFMYPFFVRYAYRLYDGSLTMHSSPILMVCSSDLAPQCFCTNLHGYNTSTNINSARLRLAAMFHKLDYAVDYYALQTLKNNWGDIVKSVDVFVSKPIYTYDQNGECKKFMNTNYSDCYAICKHVNQAASTSTYPLRYQKSKFSKLWALTFDPSGFTSPSWRLMLPQRDEDAIKADITDNALFYLLKSINVDDLQTTRTIIPVNKEYLQSLVTREVMTDDYNSHDMLIPKCSFSYNSRLNITDLKQRLFGGHNASCMFPYTNGYVNIWSDAPPTVLDGTYGVSVYFFIKQDGKDIVVNGGSASFGYETPFLWLFYPNTNAYKAIVRISQYVSSTLYEVNLEPHPTLNGAYYFGDWEGINSEGKTTVSTVPTTSNDAYRTIDIPNKIYTSEVNNPFLFPVNGINTVGTGKILSIASAAKALSQGQFGQFPLYAFTDEGVWAMEITETGMYRAKQPITRDVCINPDGITQIDSAVLFPTDRGIMLISGSNTTCISEAINNDYPFHILDLPGITKLHTMLGHAADSCLTLQPFTEFIKGCRMIYDYVHQRIIVYNKSYTYAYVFSLKTKLWGMMYSKIRDNVNSYPEALAVTTDGKMVNFAKTDGEEVNGLLVTRPLKLDAADVLKTVDTIIQRGNFQKGHVQSVVYGSRDLAHWALVWTSKDHFLRGFRGTPYKYYRIALLCSLSEDESVYGATVQYQERKTNQPR